VHPDRLVVECNEDGFTEENVRAICAIGKSSKHGAQGYIGEKGIGFKSTFMAASRVEIQSGPFSFYFQHREGDSGMGMITPIWFEPQTVLLRQVTRTTLYFHDSGSPGDLKSRRADVVSQLQDLQGTILLFLQKLRRIQITIFDSDGQYIWSKETTIAKATSEKIVELRIVESGSRNRISTRRFHVTSHHAQNLAKNDNRKYTEEEEESKAYSTAHVAVAFPLDSNDNPVIEEQELFAFMPIRKVGFNVRIPIPLHLRRYDANI
jgi:hypothetical protein